MNRRIGSFSLLCLLLLQACSQSGTSSDLKDKLHLAQDDPNCALDSINGQTFNDTTSMSEDEVATFSGWVGDSSKQTPPSVIVVLLNDKTSIGIQGSTGTARNDVVQALSAPALGNSGFVASAKLAVEPGTYSVTLLLLGPNGNERCSTHKNVVVH